MRALILLLLLAGCATPQTILRNKDNDFATCGGGVGGSVWGGMIGYSLQKSDDDRCVRNFISQGFTPVQINGIKVNN